MFVHHIDGSAFDGESNMDSATTIIPVWLRFILILWLLSVIITVYCLVIFVLLLVAAFSVPVLQAVSAYIFESRAITTVFILCRALCVLEAIGVLYGFDNRSASREQELWSCFSDLPRDCPLNLQSIFAVNIAA
jgi:hypothetical protein